jgi:hypothetical protein
MPQNPWTMPEGYYELPDGSVVYVPDSQQMSTARSSAATNTSTESHAGDNLTLHSTNQKENLDKADMVIDGRQNREMISRIS